MKVFVTGAAGRIGRVTAEKLLQAGHSVTGYDQAAATLRHAAYTHVQGDFCDEAKLMQAMQGAEAVLHLGAFMSWFEKDEATVFAANVQGTFHVLRAAHVRKLTRFVFASTGEVYPEVAPAYLPLDEHHPLRPTSLYGATKQMGEDLVWYYARKSGNPTVVLRFPHTQAAEELMDEDSFFSGPRFFLRAKIRQQQTAGNKAALAVLQPLDDGGEKLLLAKGEDGTPYRMMICDARDLADAVCLALEAPAAVGETIGVTPDRAVYFSEIIAQMQELTGLPVAEACLPGQPYNYCTSNLKAKELLGWQPQYDICDMVQGAAAAWKARRGEG